ncbi:MAG TPA: hypothetical protein VGE39_00960, partial [Prosthecobacter sp.]
MKKHPPLPRFVLSPFWKKQLTNTTCPPALLMLAGLLLFAGDTHAQSTFTTASGNQLWGTAGNW